jgi:hypothetical protein
MAKIGKRHFSFADRVLESSGFTLVDILAALAISVIGFLAMVHLQSGILRANTTSRDMTMATHLAWHLIETIKMEAVEWTNDTSQPYNQPKFKYLNQIPDPNAGSTSGWLTAFDTTSDFRMINILGRDQAYDGGALTQFPDTVSRRFCVRYRLTWILSNMLMRVDVRVLWPREGSQAVQYQACPVSMDNDMANVYSVTFSTTVMKNVFVSG